MHHVRRMERLGAGLAALAAGVLMGAAPARAADALQEVYACAAIEDDGARLACYDASVGRLQTAQTSGEVTVFDQKDVAELERRTFGFPKITIPGFGEGEPGEARAERLEEQTFVVVSSTKIGTNRYRFTMESGEVWDMTEAFSRARLRKNETNTAVIKRAALGSYLMRLNNTGASFRVRRVD